MSNNLVTKNCVPCKGDQQPLTKSEFTPLLSHIRNWEVVEDKKLTRIFKFKNFAMAIKFLNLVADLAESENHHPNLNLFGWNKLKITLTTFEIGGLSENDFILAAKIDQLDN